MSLPWAVLTSEPGQDPPMGSQLKGYHSGILIEHLGTDQTLIGYWLDWVKEEMIGLEVDGPGSLASLLQLQCQALSTRARQFTEFWEIPHIASFQLLPTKLVSLVVFQEDNHTSHSDTLGFPSFSCCGKKDALEFPACLLSKCWRSCATRTHWNSSTFAFQVLKSIEFPEARALWAQDVGVSRFPCVWYSHNYGYSSMFAHLCAWEWSLKGIFTQRKGYTMVVQEVSYFACFKWQLHTCQLWWGAQISTQIQAGSEWWRTLQRQFEILIKIYANLAEHAGNAKWHKKSRHSLSHGQFAPIWPMFHIIVGMRSWWSLTPTVRFCLNHGFDACNEVDWQWYCMHIFSPMAPDNSFLWTAWPLLEMKESRQQLLFHTLSYPLGKCRANLVNLPKLHFVLKQAHGL